MRIFFNTVSESTSDPPNTDPNEHLRTYVLDTQVTKTNQAVFFNSSTKH